MKLNKVSSENKIISSNDILQDLNQKFSLPCNDPLADKLKFATWNDIEKQCFCITKKHTRHLAKNTRHIF